MKKYFMLMSATLLGSAASAAITSADIAKYFDTTYKTKPAPGPNVQVSQMYQYPYAGLIDFAKLENDRPLSRAFLKQLTMEDLVNMDQEMSDQLYSRLSAGPIPNGIYDGKAKILEGGPVKMIVKLFTREEEPGTLGNLMNRLGIKWFTSDSITNMLGNLSNTLWKGKHFYKSERLLRNVIPENKVMGDTLGLLVKGFDYRSLKAPQPTVIQGKTVSAWELFPAKLYCGQSLTDSRRESVIIDYAYSDRLPGYQESIDFLASRQGLYVRDEIRMVRPGLYLGKAYLNRMMFLNFVLWNQEEDQKYQGSTAWPTEECWVGTQKRVLQ